MSILIGGELIFGQCLFQDLPEEKVKEYELAVKKKVKLTAEQRRQIFDKIHFEILEGYRWLGIAESHIWYIPAYSVQQGIKDAIKGSIVSMAGGSIRSKAIMVVLTIAGEIGAAVYDEYWKCEEALLRSKGHFEAAEFMQDLLFQG